MACGGEERALHKVALSGATLAQILSEFGRASGDCDGILFGHVRRSADPQLRDDDGSSNESSSASDGEEVVAYITGFHCSGRLLSFYDGAGQVDPARLSHLAARGNGGDRPIGWFVGRRNARMRPSMREAAVSHHLGSMAGHLDSSDPPSLFLLLAQPDIAQLPIHTHDYRAYQYCRRRPNSGAPAFERRSIQILNLGLAFRVQYGSFVPTTPFPMLPNSIAALATDHSTGVLALMEPTADGELEKEQAQLDLYSKGYPVEKLATLAGMEGTRPVIELEGLYRKMLDKLEDLAMQVCETSARVAEQEEYNEKSRLALMQME